MASPLIPDLISLDPEVPLPMLAMTAQELTVTQTPHDLPEHGLVTLLCGSDGVAYRVLEPPEQQPWIEILEQPAPVRFRYGTDGGKSAGTMQGINSTADKKTFPKIRLHGCSLSSGPAYVVVSCVTKDSDRPKAHPHKLVSPFNAGKGACAKGVCTQMVTSSDMTVEFQHIGIQCVTKKEVENSLNERKENKIDPFQQGFHHTKSAIDLNEVRICFQAFLKDSVTGKTTKMLTPVCSNPIYNTKAKRELQILDISDKTSPAEGGKKIILLCDKVSRDDILVRFFLEEEGRKWEALGEFKPEHVHKQYAISFTTPAFENKDLTSSKRVWLELRKKDGSTSERMEFFFTPKETKCDITTGEILQTILKNEPKPSLDQVAVVSNGIPLVRKSVITTTPSSSPVLPELVPINGHSRLAHPTIPHPEMARLSLEPDSQMDFSCQNSVDSQVTMPPHESTSKTEHEVNNLDLPSDLLSGEFNLLDSQEYTSVIRDVFNCQYDTTGQAVAQSTMILGTGDLLSTNEFLKNMPDYVNDLYTGLEAVEAVSQELGKMTFSKPAQLPERSASKRSSGAAENESGSNVVPRKDTMQRCRCEYHRSENLNTPNASESLSTINTSDLVNSRSGLNTCPKEKVNIL